MALLPNTIIYGTTSNNSSPTEKRNGGTTVGNTVATGPITKAFPLTLNAIDGTERRVRPLAAAGAGHAYNAKVAVSAGTFAYDQVQFMIKTVATKINNISNTALSINGDASNRPHTLISNKAKGAKTSTAHRSGYWNGAGIANQRTNWSTPPATNNVAFVLPTNNASNAADQGQFVTYKSIPGELAYMFGGLDAKQADFAAN